MRFAAISDVHGNVWALEAVLADIERQQIDLVVNLGDIVSGPLEPAATAERLMGRHGPTIRGNHERQLLTLSADAMNASDQFADHRLSPAHRAWLGSLPAQLWLAEDILLCHGAPNDDLTYLLETVTPAGARPASTAEVRERLGPTRASLVLCGHTHLARDVQLENGVRVVNPGSVGLQAFSEQHPFPHHLESGTPHARYAVVARESAGWRVECRAVAYDWAAAAACAARNGRRDWAHALATGFAPPPA